MSEAGMSDWWDRLELAAIDDCLASETPLVRVLDETHPEAAEALTWLVDAELRERLTPRRQALRGYGEA